MGQYSFFNVATELSKVRELVLTLREEVRRGATGGQVAHQGRLLSFGGREDSLLSSTETDDHREKAHPGEEGAVSSGNEDKLRGSEEEAAFSRGERSEFPGGGARK